MQKFRSIRRELTDSGRKAEELLADGTITKYNSGFPSSGATPEALTNYLDVSAAEPRPGLSLNAPQPRLLLLRERPGSLDQKVT